MRNLGLDIGARTPKRVRVEAGKVIEPRLLASSHDPLTLCDGLLSGRGAGRMAATGCGRRLFGERRRAEILTEIRAAAPGAALSLLPHHGNGLDKES